MPCPATANSVDPRTCRWLINLSIAVSDPPRYAALAVDRLGTKAASISILWFVLGIIGGMERGSTSLKVAFALTSSSIATIRLAVVAGYAGLPDEQARLIARQGVQAHIIAPLLGVLLGWWQSNQLERLLSAAQQAPATPSARGVSSREEELAQDLRRSREQVLQMLNALPVEKPRKQAIDEAELRRRSQAREAREGARGSPPPPEGRPSD